MYIKGFDKNLKCRGYQFEVGKEYKIENNGNPLELCSDTVFHFCDSLQKVDFFYACFNEYNRYCIIEPLGKIIKSDDKYGSNHIKIVREIYGEELNILKGLVNGNTGLFNSGYRNSGDRNSGDGNSGDRNSGYENSGYRNSGDRNSGYRNSGYGNSGNGNSGYGSSGNGNSGCGNSGDGNSGDRNSGYGNSGNRNSGYRNSGDRNSGDRNSGDRNSGDRNSGDRNSGDRNSGYGNSCDHSNGVFCNEQDMNIRIFNQPSGMSLGDFYDSKYYDAIISKPFLLTELIEYTQEEKEQDKDKKLIGYWLKTYTYKEASVNWWNKLTEENKEIIKSIPNFDADIFYDITGIRV